MNLIITNDYAAMSQAAADYVTQAIVANPTATVVFPTGNTPIGLYQELVRRRAQRQFDPSHLHIFQLDEYLGMGADDPRSLFGWFQQAFLAPLGIPARQVTRLMGDAVDPASACRAFDDALAEAGGLDLAVLGLGPNGHIGYNEPPAAGDAPTRTLTLTESSLVSAASYFGGREHVPPRALSMGMAPLLAARQILLIVSGAAKREILQRALRGPITPDVPASYLQQAANVTVIMDRAAWSGVHPEF
jgi:glucosamine-6-phosphate deaminase